VSKNFSVPNGLLTCPPRYLLKPSDAGWEDGIIALEAGTAGLETCGKAVKLT
jgi:hypothetical protein